MEFRLNGETYSISNGVLMNNSPPPYSSASPFGFHCARNSQLLDGSLQFHQKTKNPADNERISAEETKGFMISSDGAQGAQAARPVPAAMSTDFKYSEATLVTTTELRCPQTASLSVNGGTAKAGKKRSRASRRAPATMFNTDTSNFRAMVQRFTGIPETPFGYSSMNPTFSPNVAHHEWQLLGKPLPYATILGPNLNCVSHLNSVTDSYCPQQYNTTTLIPFQSLHDYVNISSPQLNLFPRAPQRHSVPSNATLLDDVGLINSESVLPSSAITLSSDRRPAYLI